MNVFNFTTKGGKDVIEEYLDSLQKGERLKGYNTIKLLQDHGIAALEELNTRQIESKLWEIKFTYNDRMFYVVADEYDLYIVHACKKQKGKAEKFELETAKKRVKELGREVNKKFI